MPQSRPLKKKKIGFRHFALGIRAIELVPRRADTNIQAGLEPRIPRFALTYVP